MCQYNGEVREINGTRVVDATRVAGWVVLLSPLSVPVRLLVPWLIGATNDSGRVRLVGRGVFALNGIHA